MPPGEEKNQKPRTPEKVEQEVRPEGGRALLNPEDASHAKARVEGKDLQGQVVTARLEQIGKEKENNTKEQQRLADETAKARTKESWVDNPASSGIMDGIAQGKIDSKVEEKFTEYQNDFNDAGLGDATNLNTLKQVAKALIFEFYQKNGSDGDKTLSYVKDTLLDKLKNLFAALKQVFESKKHDYNKQTDVLEAFSDFTKTDFIKGGFLRYAQLKDFLILDKSTFETLTGNFGKSLGIKLEIKKLEGEETGLASSMLSPKELIEQKKITFERTKITIPKDKKDTDLDAFLKSAITPALPELIRAPKDAPEKIANYLAGTLKEKKPLPDETFELSPDGVWTKIDVKSEQKTKDDAVVQAKQEAEQQTAAAVATEKKAEPFSISGIFKAIMDAFKDILKWLKETFHFGSAGIDDLVKEWKDIQPEERDQLKQFYGEVQNFFKNKGNIDALIKSPDDARRLLKAKKENSKPGENWNAWFQKHLSKFEQDQISGSKVAPKDVANYLINENGKNDAPAEALNKQPGEKPQQKVDTPAEQSTKIEQSLENTPYAADLKNILGAYIDKYGSSTVKEKIKGGNLKVADYLNAVIENFLQNDPGLKDRYQKGLLSRRDAIMGCLESAFKYALENAKTPADKEKISGILKQVNGTLDTVLKA